MMKGVLGGGTFSTRIDAREAGSRTAAGRTFERKTRVLPDGGGGVGKR